MLCTDNTGAALVASVFSTLEGEKMKVLILRDTVCGGVPVFAGSVVEASESDARILVMAHKAEIFSGEQASAPKTRTRKKGGADDVSE